ncbi:MAG: Hint domain-containing protein [Rhodobacteraceae bacterium]|nr:Hint domain-containing protein [Paracoccaceae bacterium]
MSTQNNRMFDAHRLAVPPAVHSRDIVAARVQAQNAPRQQMRRYEVKSLAADGTVAEARHVAPALPLFEDAFCAFARGALIETTAGPMAIEDLLPGDMVLPVDGDPLPVVWIGSTSLVPGHRTSAGRKTNLTRITESSFGPGRPSASLVLGPSARLLQTPAHLRGLPGGERMLTPLRSFLDGVNVIDTTPPGTIQTYHLCLPRHAIIRLSGLEFETYHPGASVTRQMNPTMRDVFLALFPHIHQLGDFGLLAHPRAAGEDLDEASVA